MSSKKILALLLAAAFILLTLTGCGNGGGSETPSKTESPNSGEKPQGNTGMWMLVNTETTKQGETDYVTFSGENGSYEIISKTDNQGSGTATATITEPPSEIKVGDKISFQISGSYTGDFPFNWECSAYLGFTKNYFTIENWEPGYEESYRVKFGTGGDLKSENSETVKLTAEMAGNAGSTVEIKIGLSGSGGISTKYTYEWRQ